MHRFHAVCVNLRLLLADLGIGSGALRLHHCEQLAIIAPEHVVHIADAFFVRHPRDFVFAVALLIERPACALQVHVDQIGACFRFRIVVRVGRFLIYGAGFRQLLLEDFGVFVEGIDLLLAFQLCCLLDSSSFSSRSSSD